MSPWCSHDWDPDRSLSPSARSQLMLFVMFPQLDTVGLVSLDRCDRPSRLWQDRASDPLLQARLQSCLILIDDVVVLPRVEVDILQLRFQLKLQLVFERVRF